MISIASGLERCLIWLAVRNAARNDQSVSLRSRISRLPQRRESQPPRNPPASPGGSDMAGPTAYVKILDVGDIIGGVAPVQMERADGVRFASLLTPEQVIYLRARLEAICDKLPGAERPFSA